MAQGLISLLLLGFLVACDSDKPADKIVTETMKSDCQMDKDGLVSTGYERMNGWAESNNSSHYVVQFRCTSRLTQPVEKVLLKIAEGLLPAMPDAANKVGMTPSDYSNSWLSNVFATLTAHDPALVKQVDDVLGKCPECTAYLGKRSDDVRFTLHLTSLYEAVAELYTAGFSADSRVGDKGTVDVTRTFMKTEKGWMTTGDMEIAPPSKS
jgi:hypothetical protein